MDPPFLRILGPPLYIYMTSGKFDVVRESIVFARGALERKKGKFPLIINRLYQTGQTGNKSLILSNHIP